MAHPTDDLFARRVLFVTGKGGVGKSTVAAALALLASERGQRVLLVDVEAKGDAARFLDAGPPLYRPRQALPNLWTMAMHSDETFEEYLKITIKLPRIYRFGPLGKVLDFIATAAPGVEEVLIAGKIGYEERAREAGRPRWDLLVVDSAPAGQVLSHIRGPRTLEELVKVGAIRNQTEWVRAILENPAKTGIVVVTLYEEMPVVETEELLERVPKEVGTPVLALVANRVVDPPEHRADLDAIAARRDDVSAAIGASIEPALRAVGLLTEIAASQAPYRGRLASLGPPVLSVPSMPVDHPGLRSTRMVAASLSA